MSSSKLLIIAVAFAIVFSATALLAETPEGEGTADVFPSGAMEDEGVDALQSAEESSTPIADQLLAEDSSPASAADGALDVLADTEAQVIDLDDMPAAQSDAEAALDPQQQSALEAAFEPLAEAGPVADEFIGEPSPPLGAVGYDSKGRQGRIHQVVRGDTLWDISDAYLGTPWVWPSIWNDNGEIENPHLIHPGDRIWITPHEMRRVTPAEADAFLANAPSEPEPAPAAQEFDDIEPQFEPVPAAISETAPSMGTLRVSARETVGLVSPEQLAASASVVGRVPERVYLSQEDQLYIGLGEGDVENGDQFTIFRTKEKVYDPDTGNLLGFHVEIVGWIEVNEIYPETALATIRMSTSGVAEGDRLIPREPLPQEIALQPSPQGVEGKISFFPQRRVLMGLHDFVYLNRGSLDGLEVGSPLEVYRTGYGAREVTRHEDVAVPDRVVATMVVVRAATEASVAVVLRADTELSLGDRFRAEQ